MTIVYVVIAFFVGVCVGALGMSIVAVGKMNALDNIHSERALVASKNGLLTKDDIAFVGWTTWCSCGLKVTFSSKTDNEQDAIARWNAHIAQCPAEQERSQ